MTLYDLITLVCGWYVDEYIERGFARMNENSYFTSIDMIFGGEY